MKYLLAAFLLSCPETQIINNSGESWGTENDHKALKRAKEVCKVKYGPKSPCLSKFIKKEPRTYWAICGREE